MDLYDIDALFTTRSEIAFIELPDYSEQFVADGTHAKRRLACMWSERRKFVAELLGRSYISGSAGSAGAKLRRDLPERVPDFDQTQEDFWDMWAVDVQFVGGAGFPGRNITNEMIQFSHSLDNDGEDNGEGLAIYDVAYSPTQYDVLDDDTIDDGSVGELERYVIRTYEPGGENLPYPKGVLQFEDTDDPVPELAPVLFPSAMLHYRWLRVPEDAFRYKTVLGYFDGADFVQGAMGAVNETTFDGYAAETLLCLAPAIEKFTDANTEVYLNIDFVFQYRPQTHQSFPRGSASGLEFARLKQRDAPSKSVFPTFDMNKIFDVSNI